MRRNGRLWHCDKYLSFSFKSSAVFPRDSLCLTIEDRHLNVDPSSSNMTRHSHPRRKQDLTDGNGTQLIGRCQESFLWLAAASAPTRGHVTRCNLQMPVGLTRGICVVDYAYLSRHSPNRCSLGVLQLYSAATWVHLLKCYYFDR